MAYRRIVNPVTRPRAGTKQRQKPKERQADFRAVVDALPDIVFVHRKGVLLHVNRAFLEAFGYEQPDELLGRDVVETLASASFSETLRSLVDREPRIEA